MARAAEDEQLMAKEAKQPVAVASVQPGPGRSKASVLGDDRRWEQVEAKMRELGYRPDALIEVLHTAQEAFGYLDPEALSYVGDRLGVPQSKVYGVTTFYSYFTLEPGARHSCVVCTGTACYLDGAGALVSAVARLLAARGEQAGPDRWLSLEEVRCLGPCSMAPVVVVDEEVHGKLSPPELVSLVGSL